MSIEVVEVVLSSGFTGPQGPVGPVGPAGPMGPPGEGTAEAFFVVPEQFGAIGDGVADDTAAFQTAVNAGVPLTLPAGSIYRFTSREGVTLPSNTYIKGLGGKIVSDDLSVGGAWYVFKIGNPYITTNGDLANITLDGIHFQGNVDKEYSTFIPLHNPGGDLTNITIKNCRFIYTGGHTESGDRYAVSLSGRPGDIRNGIYILDNYVEGLMQITANGGDADWNDLVIAGNIGRGCYNAGIALTRLSNGATTSTWTKIKILNNDIVSTTGKVGIYVGTDRDTAAEAPEIWNDIEIGNNTIDIGGTSAIDILLRCAFGASTVTALRIFNNRCKSLINASLQITKHIGANPATFEAAVIDNIFRKDVYLSVGNTVLQGNHIRGQVLPSSNAIVRMLHNQINILRMEAAASTNIVRSEYNVYRALNGQRAINIELASGTADFISANDTFEYGDTTGSATSAIRVAGAGGTISALMKTPIDNYGSWSIGFDSQSDGKVVLYAPLQGSATYDPGSLADGVGVTTTVTATNAALGDFAEASFSLDLQGITLTAWVSAANTISVRFQNESGGVLDLASGTLRVRVRKR